MKQSKSRGKTPATLQAWGFEAQEESQPPISTDLTDAPTMSRQADAMNSRDAIDEGGTGNIFNASIDQVEVGPYPAHYFFAWAKRELRNIVSRLRLSKYCLGALALPLTSEH